MQLPVFALEGVMSVFSFSTITQYVYSRFSPNKKQNTWCRFRLMLIVGLSSILNIKVTIRGQRSLNCDFFKFFYISIARISILHSYVALTTKIDISLSVFLSRSTVKVKYQMKSQKWGKSKFRNPANSHRRESK